MRCRLSYRQADFAQAHSDEHMVIAIYLDLPNGDGWKAPRRLKAPTNAREIPIIAVSANAMPENRRRAMVAVSGSFFSKPVDVKALFRFIETLSDGGEKRSPIALNRAEEPKGK